MTLRLVSDISSNCILVSLFQIQILTVIQDLRQEQTFTLINNETNDQNKATTIGEDNYTASGSYRNFPRRNYIS
jgi:hypothetical protein